MKEQQPLDKISTFVKKRYTASLYKDMKFHTYERCKKLEKATRIIAEPFGLGTEEQFILFAAAWLHDIGYTADPKDHETAGLHIATDLLEELQIANHFIERIQKLLMITPGIHHPADQLEEIFCDASTYYLSRKSFFGLNELQRQEQSGMQAEKITKAAWLVESVCWISDHYYFTEYARNMFEEKKQKNLNRLKAGLPDAKKKIAEIAGQETSVGLPATVKKNKAFPEKGIDTMFRIASANNQRISGMADNKARILITVNAIILSAIISLILKKLDQETYLIYPTFTLIGVSMFTIVIAILAIRPHITAGTFTREQFEQDQVNMLFFGNFHKMELPEFRAAMLHIMDDHERVYGTLIQDLLGQGHALGRKYHLLRIAYTIFMFGLIIAMIAFITTTVIHYHTTVTPIRTIISHP